MNSHRRSVETEPDLGVMARLNRVLPWLIGLGVLGLVLTRYVPQIHKNEEMQRQLEQKREEVLRLESEVSRLRAENNALARDPRTVERTAREQLGYARADERVVTYQEPDNQRPAPRRLADPNAARSPRR